MANTTIKISQLPSIGNGLSVTTILPVVDTTGTATTNKVSVGSIANFILTQAGNTLPPAFVANVAYNVANAAQPNITSVGTLTGLTINNINNLHIPGGTNGYVLQTNGSGNLSWVSQSGGGGNSTPGGANTQVQFNDAGAFAGNTGFTFNKTTGIFTSPFVAGNGNGLSNIQGANVSGAVNLATFAGTANAVAGANVTGTVGNANLSQYLNVSDVNNNFSYHVVLSAGSGDKSLHIDADDNLQYNPADGTLTATRVDATYVLADLQYANGYPAANVTGLGNIATINLTGSTSNVLYGNGVFAPVAGGGSNVSELVNGNNSFVLDSAGNVVFEGNVAGQAVDRGLVWDYGANANGVNSMIRQDLNGLSVRAWTENAGNYIAPVNIITGQDANTNTWRFDGQGNLTVPAGSINSTSDAGDLGAYITLTPNLGLARLTGREAQSSVNYTNTAWTSATYTGTQIDFVDSPQLVDFFNTNRFNVGVNQTISINGDEPIPFTGYTSSVGNAVIVYTSVTADPDPTTVTSIDFYYQLESYIAVDYDNGTLNVNATGLTINIDNDQTSGPDINLRSGDDILLQAKDKALGSESEGGDINIYAGDGAGDDGAGNISSSGGDIQITAGNGGDGNTNTGGAGGFTQIYGGHGGTAGVANTAGPGGYVSINGGDGGYNNGNTQLGAGGGYVNINAGLSTQEGVDGANVTITSGQGGPNALAGFVVISTPASVNGPGGEWTFDGNGILTLPDGAIIDTIGNNFEVRAIENVNFEANAVVNIYTDGSNNAYQWQFGDDGNLTLPGNTFSVNYANGSPVVISGGGGNIGNVTFDNVTVQGDNNSLNLSAGNSFTANLAYLQVRAGDVASHIHLDTGNNVAYDQYFGNDSKFVKLGLGIAGNVSIGTYQDGGVGQFEWTFDSNGNLILAGGNSVIHSIANSSLDPLNPNVSTMVLTPDPGYSSQSLVLDPTSPGHIHLRAPSQSGNIDVPAANIFLGGEDTSFEVTNGANNEARIHSAGNTWTFGNDSTTTVPGHINAIINNSITLNAYDNGAGPTIQMINWNSGSGTPTTIISSEVTEAVITTNVNATPYSWTFDNTGNLTIPGSLIAVTASPSPTLNGFSITNSMGISGNGNISTAGTITATGKIGYSTGGNATQTSTGQGVTVNQLTGLVTLATRTYNAGDLEAFSISCNKISADDFVLVQMVDSVNAPSYNAVAYPNFVLANTISVLVKTLETVGTDTPLLKFIIVKAPTT